MYASFGSASKLHVMQYGTLTLPQPQTHTKYTNQQVNSNDIGVNRVEKTKLPEMPMKEASCKLQTRWPHKQWQPIYVVQMKKMG